MKFTGFFQTSSPLQTHSLWNLNVFRLQNIHLPKVVIPTHFNRHAFNDSYFCCIWDSKMPPHMGFSQERVCQRGGYSSENSDWHPPVLAVSQDFSYTKRHSWLCWVSTAPPLLWKISTGIFFHGWRSFPHLNIKAQQVFLT